MIQTLANCAALAHGVYVRKSDVSPVSMVVILLNTWFPVQLLRSRYAYLPSLLVTTGAAFCVQTKAPLVASSHAWTIPGPDPERLERSVVLQDSGSYTHFRA